jgi:osmotically-inducible protein OsmY
MSEPEMVKQARAAIERLPHFNHERNPIDLQLRDGRLVLQGEVESVLLKKRAVHAVRQLTGPSECEDRLRVIPMDERGDAQIRDELAEMLVQDSAMHSCNIYVLNKGQLEVRLRVDDASDCWMEISVEDGVILLEGQVISLSHKRLAEALAWWVPGSRDVVNRFDVVPPEDDNDDEITDALLLVLEKDPLVHADQIRITTRDRIVTLEGYLAHEEEKEMAEADAWCLSGVEAVVNRIELRESR